REQQQFVLFTSYAMFRPSLTILVQSQMTMAQYQASSLLTINLAMTAILCLLMSLALLATLFAERMEQERSEGTRDPLSGLPSRGAFEEAAQSMLDRAQDERIAVSVILADIDHFKAVNDTWGHSAGDRVITAFGRLIASRIRPADEAGRVGGEEFCIFVWNCDESGAVALANRLRESFAQGPVKGFSKDTRFTASFGVAQWHTGETYKRVFKRADVALYQAKRGGRNSVMGSEADGLSGDKQDDGVAALSENVTETAQVVPFAQFKHQST
ncbi:MAG: GGDEF domain-containing protein, partial [Pseudomonadota bacterium]